LSSVLVILVYNAAVWFETPSRNGGCCLFGKVVL